MPIPQHFVRNVGGLIDVSPPLRPDATPAAQVTVRGPDMTIYASAVDATVDAVNTTLGSAAAAAATTVTVASATGIVVGRRYLVGNGTSAPREMVRVRGISGTTITLSRPLRSAQATGAGFVGTRLSLAVTAAQASALFWDGHAEWNFADDGNGASRNRRIMAPVECTLRPHERLATVVDLFARDPRWDRKVDTELDVDEVLDLAYEDVLEKLGGKFRVRTVVGAQGFVTPTVYQAFVMIAANYGAEWTEQRGWYEQQRDAALASLVANHPADLDQDTYIERHERGFTSIRTDRA